MNAPGVFVNKNKSILNSKLEYIKLLIIHVLIILPNIT